MVNDILINTETKRNKAPYTEYLWHTHKKPMQFFFSTYLQYTDGMYVHNVARSTNNKILSHTSVLLFSFHLSFFLPVHGRMGGVHTDIYKDNNPLTYKDRYMCCSAQHSIQCQ